MKRATMTASMLVSCVIPAVAEPAHGQSIEELKAQIDLLTKRIEQLEKKQQTAEEPVEAVPVSEAKTGTTKTEQNTPQIKKADPAFPLATQDGAFEFNLRGRLLADAGWASDRDNSMDISGTELRAARIGIEGKVWDKVGYRLEVDFAGNETTVNDAFMTYATPYGKVIIGNMKTPNSLEEQTSSRHLTFMERSSVTDAFGMGFRLGLGFLKSSDRWSFEAGVFRGSVSDNSDDESTVVAARVTYGQTFDKGVWLLGASLRYDEASKGTRISYAQRPHNHLADKLIGVSNVASQDFLYTLEAAMQFGPFHVASEWASLTAKDAGSRSRDANFTGGYVEAGWFITGEEKPLNLSSGTWGRPSVNAPLQDGGFGALQLAAKYDFIDLTDNGLYGGEQETLILGLNWYLNRHTRFMANYSHSIIEEAYAIEANTDGDNAVDALGLRFQIDW